MSKPEVLRIALFANTDWYLFNFRLSLAKRLRELGHELILLSPDGEFGLKLREMGFDWRPLPMDRRSLNPFAEARLVWRLARILRDERIDIVHGFTIKPAVYGALAGRLARVRGRVNAVAGMGYVFISNSLKARVLRPVVKTLARFAFDSRRARLIVQNPDDHAEFVGAGVVRPERVHIIPGSGVDLSRFAAVDRSRGADEPLRVLLAARMLWDKGLQEFIDAARQLHGEGRRIDFLLAGDPDAGNPASASAEAITGWVEEGIVQWLGHVSDMAGLLATVDIVVLPSYREGLPKTLIEAAGCGLPLITTDVPGCREVVSDGVDGLLCPVRQSAPLARAIARLQDDPALARRLGQAARRKAMDLFDEKIVIARTLAVYQEVLTA